MKTTSTPNPLEILANRQKSLARLEKTIASLNAAREKEQSRLTEATARLQSIDAQVHLAMQEAGLEQGAPKSAPRKRELPRGVLTMAMVDALGEFKRGADIITVTETVKEKYPKLADVPDLLSRVRNMLGNSSYFSRVKGQRGVFVLSGKELHSALFSRLRDESPELVAA